MYLTIVPLILFSTSNYKHSLYEEVGGILDLKALVV